MVLHYINVYLSILVSYSKFQKVLIVSFPHTIFAMNKMYAIRIIILHSLALTSILNASMALSVENNYFIGLDFGETCVLFNWIFEDDDLIFVIFILTITAV